MDEKFNNKYRIPSARLAPHNYIGPGDYFITICVQNRLPFFGHHVPPKVHLSPLGQIAHQFWQEIPLHYPNLSTHEFIIMPDHMHALLSLNLPLDTPQHNLSEGDPLPRKPDNGGRDVALQRLGARTDHAETPNRHMSAKSPRPGSIPAAIRSYKAAVKRWANQNGNPEFSWQARYWDSIVRDDVGERRVEAYIRNNPRKGHWVDGKGEDTGDVGG